MRISDWSSDVCSSDLLKNLAFRMKKNRKGHYTLFNIEAPAAAVLEMERHMRQNEDILRYLTVRVDAHDAGQSAMLQSRHREERKSVVSGTRVAVSLAIGGSRTM